MATVNMDRLLQACISQGAADIHLVVGPSPILRTDVKNGRCKLRRLVRRFEMVLVINPRGDIVWKVDPRHYRVYNPETGKYYHARVLVEQGTVVVRDALGKVIKARKLKPGETVEQA
jgi:hypothetical protein